MTINSLNPTCFTTGVLIGDAGNSVSTDAIPRPTFVNGLPVTAALELQSTLGGLILPRMTSAQIAAIVTPVAGMQVYNSDTNTVSTYGAAGFNGQMIVASGAITAAQFNGTAAAALQLVASPGAGKAIIVSQFILSLTYGATPFAGGGNIKLQYGLQANAGGAAASATVVSAVTFIAATANTTFPFAPETANLTTVVQAALPVSLGTVAAFTGGNASTFTWTMAYFVINV